MKILIWFLCFFALVLIQVIIKNLGIVLGGLPTMLLFSMFYWCGYALCKKWDNHKSKITENAPIEKPDETEIPSTETIDDPISKPSVIQFPGNYSEEIRGEVSPQQKKPSSKNSLLVPLIVSVVGLLSCLLYCGYIRSENAQLSQQVEDQEAQIQTLKKDIAALEDTISDQERDLKLQAKDASGKAKRIAALEPLANSYSEICDNMRYGTIGYASASFNVNKCLVVVREGNRSTKLTLTANWYQGGSVSVSYSSNNARLSFDEDTWYTPTTTLTVIPKSAGVTIATFTNSVNNETFKVLLIVTE